MYRKLEDNDVVQCCTLLLKSFQHNDGYGVGFDTPNQAGWVDHLLTHLREQKAGNMHFFTCGSFTDEGRMKGFFLASTFHNKYIDEWVMDVKDCIVDHEFNTAFMTAHFFDEMMTHIKENGGKYWRADSVRSLEDCHKYSEFLRKRYNARTYLSMNGEV